MTAANPLRLTTVPFAGFYESWHDDELDRTLDQMFSDDSGEPYPKLVWRALDRCDWRKVHEAYAKEYVERLAAEFEIKLEFESLVSPREYNFTTDRIFAYIPLREVRRLFKTVDSEVFSDVVRENFTSRSGFVSSYPNNWADWPIVPDWDHNHIGTLVTAYIRQQNGGKDMDQARELDLMEYPRCNGMIEGWIDAAIPEADRLHRIREYLNQRAER